MIADAMSDAVGLVHVVRREKHGDALGLIQVLDVRPELVAALRIEAERRLVEEQDLRRVQEAARDLEPPLHPAGELLHRRVAPLPELEQLEQRLRARRAASRAARGTAPRGASGSPRPSARCRGSGPGRRCRTAGGPGSDGSGGFEPSSAIDPAVGRSRVVSIWIVVVFPAPFGPRNAKISPRATSKEMSLTAWTSPKLLERLRTSIMFVDMPSEFLY